MGVRSFGAQVGAGPRVVERQPAKPINPGVLGFTLFVGAFRSGPVGEVKILDFGEAQAGSIYGGLTRDSQAPLALADFYRTGEGAGKAAVLRITDGTHVKAGAAIYDRHVSRSVLWRAPASRQAGEVARVTDASGGRSGGRARYQSGEIVSVPDAVTIEIPLGATPLEDEWIGAILAFSDITETYKIIGNTAANPSIVTVEGELSAAAQAQAGNSFFASLENVHDVTDRYEGIAVEIGDGGVNPATMVSVLGHRDGALVRSWLDKDLDAAGRRYLPTSIADDESNYLLEWTQDDDWTGNPVDPLDRPANYAEVAAVGGLVDAVPNAITLQTWRWSRISPGGGLAYVQQIDAPDQPKACTIVLTFTAATSFTVTATLDDGGEVISDLPAGSTVAQYASGSPYVPDFRIRAGSVAMAATNTITIKYRPLPSGLSDRGGYLYAAASAADGDVRKRWKIATNTDDTLTFASTVDLTSEIDAPAVPVVTSGTAGPYTLVPGETVIYTLPGGAAVTLIFGGAPAGPTSATATAAALQALEDASAGSAALRRVVFGVTPGDKLTISAVNDAGAEAILNIGAGTANATLDLDPGDTAGTDGTIVRLQWRQELRGGYDGLAGLTSALVAEAFDLDDSPANQLLETNTGLIAVCAPGWADDDVNQAGTTWAWNTNSLFYAETADTVTDEGEAITAHAAWALDSEKMAYQNAPFPAYGKRANPYGSGLLTCTIMGALLGEEARKAVADNGYHTAPAGEALDFGDVFRDLTTGDRVLNNELLNAYGLIEIRKRGRAIYPYGDRIALGDGREWKHKRKALSHIGRVLLTNTSALVWLPSNDSSMKTAIAAMNSLFIPLWRAGWFSDDAGAAFEKQVQIKCDATNNPLETRQLGDFHIGIGLLIVDTAERVIFTLGPRGVSEAPA